MEDDSKTVLTVPAYTDCNFNNPNPVDAEMTVRFASGSFIRFHLASNGTFAFRSEGDITDVSMRPLGQKNGPRGIDMD